MKDSQIGSIRKKLESGVFPMDLSIEEQKVWSDYKGSLQPKPLPELSPEQEEELYRWLLPDQKIINEDF